MAVQPPDEAKKKSKEDDVRRKAERAKDGAAAMAQYEADARAVREKTSRLRALRLAKEAQDLADAPPPKKKAPAVKKALAPGEKAPAKAKAPAKSKAKAGTGVPLASWLDTQQGSGRRS